MGAPILHLQDKRFNGRDVDLPSPAVPTIESDLMLEKEIARLAVEIRAAVSKYKSTGSIPTRRDVRVRRRDFTLKYQEDFGFANFSRTRIEKDTWDWNDQARFLESVVQNMNEYGALAAAIGASLSSLENFARQAALASYQGLDDNELDELVGAFGNELAGQPLPVKITAFIDGLLISESPLLVSANLVLRKPIEEDVAEHILLDDNGGISIPMGETWFRTVGDFTFAAVNTGLAQKEFLRTMGALRLFKTGGVTANRYEMRSRHSFLSGRAIRSFAPGNRSRFTCEVTASEATTLSRFLHHVVPLLPDPFDANQGTMPKGIAYTRYSDGLFHSGPLEQAATSAVTALEALFLRKEEKSELSHRLAQRTSVFLRVLGSQPDAQKTYKEMKKGYDIRSTYVHGGSVDAAQRANTGALAQVLMNYARCCVLAFLQTTETKEGIISQLDMSMIDPLRTSDLELSLTPVVHK